MTETTTPDPESLTNLRRDMRAVATKTMEKFRYGGGFDERARTVADVFFGIARTHLDPMVRRIAELEEGVRALGGDPDHMVQDRAEQCLWFCESCRRCHGNACPASWGGNPEVRCGHTPAPAPALPDPSFASHVGYPDIEAMTRARMAGLDALAVREVPAGEAREGDTVTETRTGRVIRSGDDLFEVAWPDGAGTFYKREEAGHLTVSRPVSPLPDQPGVFGSACKALGRDQSRFNLMTMERDGELYFVAAHGSEYRAHEIADFQPAAAAVSAPGQEG